MRKKIKYLRMNVTEVLAHLTVSIDFSEEDVEETEVPSFLRKRGF